MVTLKQIAEECNVSIATVSNVLNGRSNVSAETRRMVMNVVDKYGYRPNFIAQGLRKKSTHLIGVIAEDIAQFSTPPIVEGIMTQCEKSGYRTIAANMRLYAKWKDTWYNNTEAVREVLAPIYQEMLAVHVDGLIYIAGHNRYTDYFPEKPSLPVVMTYATEKSPYIPSVLIDDEASAKELVDYLISKGHKRIGVIGGAQDNLHTKDRLMGYQKALFEAGIPSDPTLVCFGGWEPDTAYVHCEKLIREKNVTAIFCMNDRMAGGVYRYLDEKGMRAGREVSVIGYDDQDMAPYFLPSLTTTALPLEEMGRLSCRLLIGKLEKQAEKETEGKTSEDMGQAGNSEILKSGEQMIWRVPCSFRERNSVSAI